MISRASIINGLQTKLSMPRIQISIILLLTAAVGFLTSIILLAVGMTDMALRYPLAVVMAYLTFLILLRIWLWLQDERSSIGDITNIGDIGGTDLYIPNIGGGGGSPKFSTGGGGDFGGGGSGGSWDETPSVPMPVGLANTNAGGSSSLAQDLDVFGGGGGGGGSFDIDLDDGLALLVVIVVLVLIFGALIYVVWIAPILMAELIVDAAVVSALYRPVQNIERRYWLVTALRKTGIPAAIILVLFVVAGLVMQAAEPEAATIGQFFRAVL